MLTVFNGQVTDSQKVKKPVNLVRILGIAGLLVILGVSLAMGTIAKSPSNLLAAIQGDGVQFQIFNNNDFQWKEVNMVLNNDFKFKADTIDGHSEFTAQYTQFVKDDSTVFDAATMTPFNFYIFAQVPNNQTGSWFYKFP